jgi:hypothetical protein
LPSELTTAAPHVPKIGRETLWWAWLKASSAKAKKSNWRAFVALAFPRTGQRQRRKEQSRPEKLGPMAVNYTRERALA